MRSAALIGVVAMVLACGIGCAKPAAAADTVYVTNTGKRYHALGCRWLYKSSIPMSRAEAQKAGLTPCKECQP